MGYSGTYLRQFPTALLDELIARFGLHAGYPVDPHPLFEGLNVGVYIEKAGLPASCRAFTVRPRQGPYAVTVLNGRYGRADRRQSAFHELGHLVMNHAELRHECGLRPGGPARHEELEAWVAAAYLAVPAPAVLELDGQGYTAPEIAAALRVSPELLELRCLMMRARNELGTSRLAHLALPEDFNTKF